MRACASRVASSGPIGSEPTSGEAITQAPAFPRLLGALRGAQMVRVTHPPRSGLLVRTLGDHGGPPKPLAV